MSSISHGRGVMATVEGIWRKPVNIPFKRIPKVECRQVGCALFALVAR